MNSAIIALLEERRRRFDTPELPYDPPAAPPMREPLVLEGDACTWSPPMGFYRTCGEYVFETEQPRRYWEWYNACERSGAYLALPERKLLTVYGGRYRIVNALGREDDNG